MGITLALLSMTCFACNILIARSAVARLPVETGFTILLSVNVLFISLVCAVQFLLRDTPLVFPLKGMAWFALAGIVGIFLGRRMMLDAVLLLGPARASVLHSSSPIFTLVSAWVMVDERLGAYELSLVALVVFGLWNTQLPARGVAGDLLPVKKFAWRAAIVALLTVAGFGLGNALRGVAMRAWDEAVFGTLIATATAWTCHMLTIRDWRKLRDSLFRGDRRGRLLFVGSGIATAGGSMFTTAAMGHMEIAIATLVTFTTPLLVFPVSVFILGNREGLTLRTVAGAAMVLAGIVLLALR